MLADPHELIVQFGIHHLHFLELEDLLATALSQLTFALLQTLDHLRTHVTRHGYVAARQVAGVRACDRVLTCAFPKATF